LTKIFCLELKFLVYLQTNYVNADCNLYQPNKQAKIPDTERARQGPIRSGATMPNPKPKF
jgi:hypothetical protein